MIGGIDWSIGGKELGQKCYVWIFKFDLYQDGYKIVDYIGCDCKLKIYCFDVFVVC